MSKHTPPPWRMIKPSPRDKEILIEGKTKYGYGYVCSIPRDDCDHDEALANGRLIELAPKLLACLNDILSEGSDAAGDGWAEVTVPAETLEKARALTARAEGRRAKR